MQASAHTLDEVAGALRKVAESCGPKAEAGPMTAILVFFAAHWVLSIFAQTFFLHRYGAHRMFTMSRFWDRFFYVFAFVAQGPSFLIPRAYAYLHREHHAFADSRARSALAAQPRQRRGDDVADQGELRRLRYGRAEPEARFRGGTPEWPALDAAARSAGRCASAWARSTRSSTCVRAVADLVRALADPLAHGADPRRHRQLVRPQVRLPQLRHARRQPQHAADRLLDHGRAVPEQPPPARRQPATSRRAGSRSIRATRSCASSTPSAIIDLEGVPAARLPVEA